MTHVDTELARMIDHTLLRPEATPEQIERLCDEARQYDFASVCVNSSFVPRCLRKLETSPVKVCAVVGFPLGAAATAVKAAEAAWAVENGAKELDMVLAVGRLKAGDTGYVREDIEAVVSAGEGGLVKVILETSLLNHGEKVTACEVARDAGAHFVKTATGFGPGGATVKDVRLMHQVVAPDLGVKASGGIRERETALKLIEAGATRIGASASVALVTFDA